MTPLPPPTAGEPGDGAPDGALELASQQSSDQRSESGGSGPRRPVPKRLAALLGVVVVAVLLVAGAITMVMAPDSPDGHQGTAFAASAGGNRSHAAVHPSVHLAPATSAPAPVPVSVASAPPVQSHEVFGYAPYWTLPKAAGFDVKNLTTLAYFSVDANADGTLAQSGPGWDGYQSQDLVDLVNRAHAAGDRVVLTVACFDQHTLNVVTSDPNAPARLSAALIAAVKNKSLDGVNFDFEGEGSADRAGLTNLVTKVSAALHATDPHWQVTMAAYASSASDTAGFTDVAAVAPAVDAFFVMAYDMNSKTVPGPTSPLFGPGFNDVQALEAYCKVVPPSKVILGLPYYGYDWPTTDGSGTATATGPESPLTDSVIAAGNHPTYWDPVTNTPWTAYQVGTQWHKTYYDDPTSLALKAQLANFFHIAGVGIWALGMDGNNPAMLAALLGNAPVAKDGPTGPPPPPGTGFLTVATYAGTSNIPLTPVVPPPSGGTSTLVGTVTSLSTSDPALACLQTGPALQVWSYSVWPGMLVVQASTPTDCAVAMWAFPIPAPVASSTTTLPASSTTSTTSTTSTSSTTSTTSSSSTSTSTSTSSTTSTSTLPAPAVTGITAP